MIHPSSFQCTCCGACCKDVTVKLIDSDIKRLERAGHRRRDFAEKDGFDPSTGTHALKQTPDRWCVFLRKEAGFYTCSVWEDRPSICRTYPFFDDKPLRSCLPEGLVKVR